MFDSLTHQANRLGDQMQRFENKNSELLEKILEKINALESAIAKLEPKMRRQLSIEIQDPKLATDFFESVLTNNNVNKEFTALNVWDYTTDSLDEYDFKMLWGKIQKELVQNKPLAEVTIVVCTDERGWDDYLLLYHFDKTEELDTLP